MHIRDLDKLANEDSIDDDIKIVSNVLKKICKYMKDINTFINIIKKFQYVSSNEEICEWINEDIEPEEEEKDDKEGDEKEKEE